MNVGSTPAIQIDLNGFKLHLHLKDKIQLTLHFNSPSRRFYLSLIALVINEMKRSGKIRSIPLKEHFDLLALLNETVGGAAGSSEEENLLHRIYTKWKDALPNLEEAPLFKVIGRKKEEGEGTIGKIYSFTDAEKDAWANLFEYVGSHENVRLRFAMDKIGIGLNETAIIFGDFQNEEAWDQFIAGLRKEEGKKEKFTVVEEAAIQESPAVPLPLSPARKIIRRSQYGWVLLILVIGVLGGAIWKIFLSPPPLEVASADRMKYPLPDKPSIAVLPFVNLSEDPKQEYFVDGMTDDLITGLSKISGLLVISRNSTFTYKGKPVKAQQVAEEFGVRYILEGSVRWSGEEVRINAQLIDALTGHHVWAERYDGTIGKIFDLQDQISRKIISALAVKLTAAENKILAQNETDNMQAYHERLRGSEHFARFTPDDLVKAVQSFKKAVDLDPNYSQAYASLAYSYYKATLHGGMHKGLEASGVPWGEARLLAGKYLKLAMRNPTAQAHVVNALYYLFRRQHEEAISELERALVLDPNLHSCNEEMGRVLSYAGRPKEAVDFIHRAIRINPPFLYGYSMQHGIAQFCMGTLEDAAALIGSACKLKPEIFGCAGFLASCNGLLGREKEARAALGSYKEPWEGEIDLPMVMYFFPFKDRAVADRFAEGLIKAGIKAPSWRYYPVFKENQLTGEEIKRLRLGSKVTGIDWDGRQWWIDADQNGEIRWRGSRRISSDTGKMRIEGDLMCLQYKDLNRGHESCNTIFRNPKGTFEEKNEYVSCTDYGFAPFSVVRRE